MLKSRIELYLTIRLLNCTLEFLDHVCIPTEAQKELNKSEIDEEVVEKVM